MDLVVAHILEVGGRLAFPVADGLIRFGGRVNDAA
jgi:hypothetical protein